MSSLQVCSSPATLTRRIRYCPICERRRRFVFASFEWYSSIAYCCGCGDAWGEDGRMARPFRRGWREEAIASAKRLWEKA